MQNRDYYFKPEWVIVGFMGNRDLWGFIIFHKSEWGFIGIHPHSNLRKIIKKKMHSPKIWARILYPDLGQNLGPRPKSRTFEIRIQFHYSDLNLGLGLNLLT